MEMEVLYPCVCRIAINSDVIMAQFLGFLGWYLDNHETWYAFTTVDQAISTLLISK